MKIQKFLNRKTAVVSGALVLSAGAHADLSSAAVTAVTGVGTDITAVGVAIIGLAAIALGVRWVKASFF